MNEIIDYIGLFVFLYPAIMAVYWGSTGLVYFLKQEKLSRSKKFADYPNYKYHTDAPLVSLLVPCYNEADNIDESLPFLLKSNYPNLAKSLLLELMQQNVFSMPKSSVIQSAFCSIPKGCQNFSERYSATVLLIDFLKAKPNNCEAPD